ncbi:MAG TPA: DUF2891 domain-containing protein [Thermoanaerobaculia bacterium]|nr:DUF2891 domain-containing protein [Thermoanaerobaculia bacterium]
MNRLILAAMALALAAAPVSAQDLDAQAAERFANLALSCVNREYPNKISHNLNSDKDVAPPRKLTPAFFGCYDWHSSVHGHWLLARLAKTWPSAPFAQKARYALKHSITPENIAAEVAYLKADGRASFERPYGLAWLLQLSGELHEWDDPLGRELYANIQPLEQAAVERLRVWLPKLSFPVRSGEHSQTAFALGLALDSHAGGDGFAKMIKGRATEFYRRDKHCPLEYEPSGEDFLSPCLAEADLMRRVLPPVEFAAWLGGFLPHVPAVGGSTPWLRPVVVTDPSDPKLAHLDGLNLSRAWMLEGIASGLPEGDPRIESIQYVAGMHRSAGLSAVTGEHYEGGHWLGSFATYLVTNRGLTK